MKRLLLSLCAAASLGSATAQPGPEFYKPNLDLTPKMQVVFALDCTGSMSGLIQTAKDKIWTIASSLAQSEQQLDIEIGLVAYRDRGDAFVTQVTDLNADLDYVYNQLMQLRAAGGGDGPESVNQALNDAIHQIDWSASPMAVKTVFLVGDCAPHMDYEEKQYPELCQEAGQQGITINTILMGTNNAAQDHWTSIAYATNGDFFSVGMDANNVAVTTPYDERIRELNMQLDGTRLYYGSAVEVSEAEEDAELDLQMYRGLDDAAIARRSAFNFSEAGMSNQYQRNELLNNLANGTVTLDAIEVEELPDSLQAMPEAARVEHVEELLKEREALEEELRETIAQREAHVAEVVTTDQAKSGFAGKVWSSLRKQAKANRVDLPEAVKY